MPKKEVFISYKAEEFKEAAWVKDALETNGISCWMAPMSIPGGSSYASEIEQAIKGCKVFVLILSKKAQDSKWVTKELDRALNSEKIIMPFDIENYPLNDAFNFYLTDVQRYEAFSNKSKAFEKMLTDIRKVLAPDKEPSPAEATAVAVTPTPVNPIEQKPSDAPAAEPVPCPAPPDAQDMVIPGVIDENKRRKKKKKTLAVVISAAAVLLAAIIALFVFVMSGNKRVEHPAGVISTADDLLNFTFELEGVTYQLPCPYEEFANNGWEISSYTDKSENSEVAGKSSLYLSLTNGEKIVSVSVFNTSGNSKTVKQCDIGHIVCQLGDGASIKFSNGVTPYSDHNDILSAFGTPYEHYTYDYEYDRIKYIINSENDVYLDFTCYLKDDKKEYSSIEISNIVYGEIDPAETNTQVPEYLKSYVAPTELGGDINSGIIEIEEKLYRLPAPISEFIDDGWKITNEPEAITAGGDAASVTLKREGKSIFVTLKNFADYQTVAENCAVTSVRIESVVNANLAGGPYIGCSKSVADIVGDEFEVSKYSSHYYYTYSQNDPYIYVTFEVDKDTKKVTDIYLTCYDWIYQ